MLINNFLLDIIGNDDYILSQFNFNAENVCEIHPVFHNDLASAAEESLRLTNRRLAKAEIPGPESTPNS